MSNKPQHPKSKTKITKITASARPETKQPTAPTKAERKSKSADRKSRAANRKAKADRVEKPLREVFILARPFVGLGRYLRDSWREIRLVRWPNRKATWKMTAAVLVYCAIFMVFILLLDMFFTFIFDLILGK